MSKQIQKQWSLSEIEWIRANIKSLNLNQIATHFNVSRDAVKGVVTRYKIFTGRDTRFKPGHTSWNKGKPMRLNPTTEFKKGHLPHNTRHDGAISIRRDKTGRDYKYIRIAKAKWELLHRFVWMEIHGPIPANRIVTFIDGNSLNCSIENLKLISRREHMMRCGHTSTARGKASKSMKDLWYKEKLRKAYGMSAKTGLGKLINSI
jgi:hypothetical protein